jgi:hypothetical protein
MSANPAIRILPLPDDLCAYLPHDVTLSNLSLVSHPKEIADLILQASGREPHAR